ncbi:UDP-glucose dehydrogenase family protein [Patescibacteria group bacterium]
MNISVIGTGYVGLVTASVFADLGNKVYGLDVDKNKIENLKKGITPFFEPGLKKLVLKNLKNKRLSFTTSYKKTIPNSDVIFICVGTPAKKNGDYDLSYVFSAAKSIGEALKKYAVICIKSTVPPSTNSKVSEILKKQTKLDFDLASCPEFLQEGSAINDAFNPNRVVIGTDSKKAKDILIKLHKPFKAPRVICDVKSAQMIKYAANAFLATKISFINSIAHLSEEVGANIDYVARGLGLDPRIGNKFLQAGLGYGGSCFPKDTWALIAYAKRLGYDFKFLKEVDNVNEKQILYFVKKIKKKLNGDLKNKTLTILGLSFKPHTDDIREARATELIKVLLKSKAKIHAFDPKAMDNAKKVFKNVKFFKSPYKALEKSSALLIVTEWPEFAKLNFAKIAKIMKEKVIIDGRNLLDSSKIKKLGFQYEGIGRN